MLLYHSSFISKYIKDLSAVRLKLQRPELTCSARTTSVRSFPTLPSSELLLLCVPKSRGGNADDAAAEPAPRVSVQQAASVSTATQVVLPLVHHHRPPDGRRASEQCGLALKGCSDFPFLGLEVPKVPWVVGVGRAVWIEVSPGGGAALAQVSVLVDVNSFGCGVCSHATETQLDLQLSLGVDLLEEHLAVDFG